MAFGKNCRIDTTTGAKPRTGKRSDPLPFPFREIEVITMCEHRKVHWEGNANGTFDSEGPSKLWCNDCKTALVGGFRDGEFVHAVEVGDEFRMPESVEHVSEPIKVKA